MLTACLLLQMVVIVDPHVKRAPGYPVYEEAKEKGIFVQTSSKGEYEGWCWPGSSSWVDYFHPDSWDWWKGLFKLYDDGKKGWRWKEVTKSVFIWNDMNEVGLVTREDRSSAKSARSLLCSMVPRSLCPRITFTMEAGNTEMSTTPTACFSCVSFVSLPEPLQLTSSKSPAA